MGGPRQQNSSSSGENGVRFTLRREGNRQNMGHRGQVRAAQHRHNSEVTSVLRLIDRWGNETTLENRGQMSRIKHKKVLAVLEKRALRYKYGNQRYELIRNEGEGDRIDE